MFTLRRRQVTNVFRYTSRSVSLFGGMTSDAFKVVALQPHLFRDLSPCVLHLARGELTLGLGPVPGGESNAGVMSALLEHTAGMCAWSNVNEASTVSLADLRVDSWEPVRFLFYFDNNIVLSDIRGVMESSWEKSVNKHIFVLSSAGKPIFSRYGDEQEIVTTFGLIQAVISIVQDSGDSIQCIQSGSRRIVYFSKNSLYFVSVSSTGEPEAVLRQQLEFIHAQVIFVLTAKVHDILRTNPSKDLRELLGADTKRLMHAACEHDLTPAPIVFSSVRGFALDSTARLQLLSLLRQCLSQSGAALGCVLCEDSLLVCATNEDMQGVTVEAKDLLLLAHFVNNSPSLRCHDQNNWVPLCLPSLNAAGYVQAYISPLQLSNDASSLPLGTGEPSALSLILISASNGSGDDVKRLHDARIEIQNAIADSKIASRVAAAVANQGSICQKLLSTVHGLHFFYKYKPSDETPAQCIWSDLHGRPTCPSELENRIWIHCFRLALCLRTGSGSAECTLLSPAVLPPGPPLRREQANALASDPAADHALTYTTLDSGEVCVGLATSYSELFVTFPNTVDALEACGLANVLTRSLSKDADSLFFSS